MAEPYRDLADREDNVIPIRPKVEVPPPPPAIWPWVAGAILAIEAAVAYGVGFHPSVFIYAGMVDTVILCLVQTARTIDAREKLKSESEKKQLVKVVRDEAWLKYSLEALWKSRRNVSSAREYEGKNLPEAIFHSAVGKISEAESMEIAHWVRQKIGQD